MRSSTPNVDLQATVSEVRPDGKETFVQNGWLRGDERKLDPKKSTPLEPVLSLRESDVSPLPADRFVKVTIPLYYEGHAYRAGSRIRVTISAPNGTQPIWAFDQTQPKRAARRSRSPTAKDMPSQPPAAGRARASNVPTGLPPCPGLRGEPCRDYVPFANRSVSADPPADGSEPPAQSDEPPAAGDDLPIRAASQGLARRGTRASKCGKRPQRKHRHRKHRGHKRTDERILGKHGRGGCHRKRLSE